MKDKCFQVAKLIAAPHNYEDLLYRFCGKIFQYMLEHYVCYDGHTSNDRDTFWDIVRNVYDVNVTVDWFTMEDKLLVNVLEYLITNNYMSMF